MFPSCRAAEIVAPQPSSCGSVPRWIRGAAAEALDLVTMAAVPATTSHQPATNTQGDGQEYIKQETFLFQSL